jgi:hypothetical protein
MYHNRCRNGIFAYIRWGINQMFVVTRLRQESPPLFKTGGSAGAFEKLMPGFYKQDAPGGAMPDL